MTDIFTSIIEVVGKLCAVAFASEYFTLSVSCCWWSCGQGGIFNGHCTPLQIIQRVSTLKNMTFYLSIVMAVMRKVARKY